MIGLSGPRVMIVDDELNDALPMFEAFARRGIPTVYFSGREDGLPPPEGRLSGVRLAILDMVLTMPEPPAETIIAQLLVVIERILSPANGPYICIIWTRRSD